jgi:thiamine-phosphate pyrophosphorylase
MSRHEPIALMLVTDRELCGTCRVEDVVMQAIAGGVDCVQLREKQLGTRGFVEQALRLKEIMRSTGVPLIINDRLDVALAAQADGIHLGQEDMPVPIARRLLGANAIIGLSVESWADVERAQDLDVAYLGVSPIFKTPTKTDTKGAWGLEGLARIQSFSRHALIGIGGLNRANITDVVTAGAHGVAVVSAICSALDPTLAAKELLQCVKAAKAKPPRCIQC